MLLDYLNAALQHAKFEALPDKEGYVGTIPGLRGVIGYGRTLSECRRGISGALQAWLLVGLRHGDRIPVIDGINLNPPAKSARRPRARTSQKAA